MEHCKYAIVGEENFDNLRLYQILKEAYGKEYVVRYLELQYLEPFLVSNQSFPIVVCLDLFSFEMKEVTDFVGRIREAYPKVVFNLYVDKNVYNQKSKEIPLYWKKRFMHYFKTFKESPDIEYEPIVRGSLRPSENEAIYNMYNEPVRLTPVFKKGLVGPDAGLKCTPDSPMTFISYSRSDWQGFVSPLVSDLAKESHKVWIDQHYIEGGNDWLDAIGEALQVCKTLLLVIQSGKP